MFTKKPIFKLDEGSSPEELLFKYRYQILFILLGLILVGFGTFLMRKESGVMTDTVEVLEVTTQSEGVMSEVVVEVSGAVEKPGVYKLQNNARIEDALIAAGGVSANADREWMEKLLNRAAKIQDGQKIYIPKKGEQSQALSANDSGGYQTITSNFSGQGSGLININTATQKELESLYGIGPVYAQNIVEHRPYSTVEELLSKDVLKKHVYEKIKDKISVY